MRRRGSARRHRAVCLIRRTTGNILRQRGIQMTPQWPRIRQSTVVFLKLKKQPGSSVAVDDDCARRSRNATQTWAPGTTASEKATPARPGAGLEAIPSVSPTVRIARSPMKAIPASAQIRLAVALRMRELQIGPSASKTWSAAAPRASRLAASRSQFDRIDFRIALVPTTLFDTSTQVATARAGRLSMNKAAHAMTRKIICDRPMFISLKNTRKNHRTGKALECCWQAVRPTYNLC